MEITHTALRSGRLSSFLREELGLSYGLMNRLKWQDKLFVNGIPRHADFQISIGDVISVPLEEPEPDYPAQDGPLTIIYEDAHILVVDKPAGMLIHPSRSRLTDTLANYVLGHYQKQGQQSAFHPLTRLDRDTFGIVLLAKNSHIHAKLSASPIEKTYQALVYKQISQNMTIDAPIARLPLPSLLRQVDAAGKPCTTHLRVLQNYDHCTRVALTPVTGRTHQLRVHCAHIGHPILGDPQYGTAQSQDYSLSLGLHHQQLCATQLQFTHPVTGEAMTLNSTLTTEEIP